MTMRYLTRIKMLCALLFGVCWLGSGSAARADFEVKFDFGGAEVIIHGDGSTSVSGGASITGALIIASASEINILNLTVSSTGTTGGFKISATIADSNSPGSNNIATLDLSSLQIKNQTGVAGNSTLFITSGDTGFTQPLGQPTVRVTSTISATASGTNSANAKVVFNSFLDTTNTQFGTQQGTPTITLDPINPGASASGNSSADLNAATTPYSLTEIAQITLANGDKLTDGSSGTTATAPVPTSLLLALSGMPVLGLVYLRRKMTAPAIA